MPLMLRVIIVVGLLAVGGFCAMGFMATFEPPGWVRLRICYGLAGAVCFGGVLWALFARSSATVSEPPTVPHDRNEKK